MSAYSKVFGAAVEANKRYKGKIKHPVTGELAWGSQVRFGKTKKDRKNQ